MNELALPDPQTLAAAQVPALVTQVTALRVELRRREDVSGADELRRRLAAYERYVADRNARRALEAESRRTEVLIGQLLGPADGALRRNDLNINDRFWVEFRRMADFVDLVESEIAAKRTARAKILVAIERRKLAANTPAGESAIRAGDFRKALADLPDESVDLIFTDPPYAKTYVPLYEDLAELGARVLKPGASLLAYCGQYALPEVLESMGRHLRYWWLCACVHTGFPADTHRSLPGIKAYVIWKPIVWFVSGTNGATEFVHDAILRPKPSKVAHDWAQALDEPLHYIEKLCPPDGLVVDPFAGGGTTLIAARQLGRRFIGAELDPDHRAVAEARVA